MWFGLVVIAQLSIKVVGGNVEFWLGAGPLSSSWLVLYVLLRVPRTHGPKPGFHLGEESATVPIHKPISAILFSYLYRMNEYFHQFFYTTRWLQSRISFE